MEEVKSGILIRQSEIISELAELNKYLLSLLSQHLDVSEEKERLKEILCGCTFEE